MFRALYSSKSGQLRTNLELVDLAFALYEPDGLLWVDFYGNHEEKDEEILAETFGFHPLAIDDAIRESHVPKIDNWGNYLYLVFQAISIERTNILQLEAKELDIFVGKNYIVTHHDQAIDALDHIWSTVQRSEKLLKHGTDHLLYRIADEVIGSYMSVFNTLEDEIDHLEVQVFNKTQAGVMERAFNLNRILLNLRRILIPQREVLNKLSRDEFEVIDTRDQMYFRDVYDHLVRMHNTAESMQELVSGTLGVHLSMVNNRLNEVVKVLTIITTFFMPLTFITSFFGMNFFFPRQAISVWMEKPVFILVLAVLFISPVLMLRILRRKGWLK